ncbi:Uma2 family endonuclease [Thiorhodococcus mannitoliphagus]|uniref:Uma2 family endonuclease n=1 Tax=Thiorhodococcus mannitoliphagus TaxID=329406 RepID=A0A6P1DRB1_9GAMM|nr:Uma2 family endonuclease [Thiorhodococcus mannitoliphagus]NEX20419.1 Uma2 family endonuclease [Thiorhodococcus mannitoliphagus]
MHATHPFSRLSVEAYLAAEEGGELRHEYIDGQIYAMTGASRQHGLIVSNLVAGLRPLIRGRGCQLFSNDMKIRLLIAGQDIFYYPDLLLSCDPDDRETYYCTQPCVIVEVLSESTERIDRREKFLAYTTLPSLQDYLLVSQTRREVWHYRRSRDWAAEVLTDGDLGLDCLAIRLPLDLIYEEIEEI